MLYEAGRLDQLKEYVQLKKDPQLYRWWAQHLESKHSTAEAL